MGILVRYPFITSPNPYLIPRIGVMKSVMGELTDTSNRAEGFSLMPVVWAFGCTLGYACSRMNETQAIAYLGPTYSPLMGGSLSRPSERFPEVFGGNFWREYPYFLPCVATSSFVLAAFLVTLCLFKEVRHCTAFIVHFPTPLLDRPQAENPP